MVLRKTQIFVLVFSMLKEDLWSGLWQCCAHPPETIIGVVCQQQGFFNQAQELALVRVRQVFLIIPAPIYLQIEYR